MPAPTDNRHMAAEKTTKLYLLNDQRSSVLTALRLRVQLSSELETMKRDLQARLVHLVNVTLHRLCIDTTY